MSARSMESARILNLMSSQMREAERVEREARLVSDNESLRRALYELLHDVYGPNPKYKLITNEPG